MNKDKFKKRAMKIFRYSLSIIILASIVYFAANAVKSPEAIKNITQSVGIFGPLVLVCLIILGVLLTPVPAALIIMAAGYLYGSLWGSIFSYIGHVFAALMTFLIYRKHGNIGKRSKKYENFVKNNQSFLYALYIMPVIPISIISMASAAAKIPWRKYVRIVLLSFIPNVVFFAYFGSQLEKQNLKLVIGLIFVALVAAIFIIRYIRKNIK